MKKALLALNSIKKSGVIDDYAIGGAIAASFYIEAVNTEDVDVFLFLSASENSVLLTLQPIYDALKKLGGRVEKEYIVIGDWPVQILPAYSPLVEEAVRQAVSVQYSNIETRIFSAEHLCAIALDTGRMKDFYRVASFILENAVKMKKTIHASTGSARTVFMMLTQLVSSPFALGSPRSGRVEGLITCQLRFSGLSNKEKLIV